MTRKAPIPFTVTRNWRNDYQIEIWANAKTKGEPGTGYAIWFDEANWNHAACFIMACNKGNLRQYLADLRSAYAATAQLEG